ncbi:MAG: transglutaminase domain-containing protein [Limnobacter sp.]|uniref:transglutaminase domain-containing protein n=1 Tax=Limnobacter sp. TaxID=2003368 RepID=UPI0039198F5C
MSHSVYRTRLLVLLASFWIAFSPPASAFSLGQFWDRITGKEFSPERMAKELTKGVKDERQKAQRLFDWITENIVYDVEAYRTGLPVTRDLDQLMRVKKGTCDDYAQLFNAMATSVGLSSEIKTGVVHDASSPTGVAGHAWNVVNINGRTLIVDTTWGAGYYDHLSKQFTKGRDLRYFLADPAQILLSHREEDQNGQPVELPGFSFEQFRQAQTNTRRLARLGVPAQQLISRLGSVLEGKMPVAEDALDELLRIRRVPLERPQGSRSVRFEISHSFGTTLALRTDKNEIPFLLSTDKTVSTLDYNAAEGNPFVIVYKLSDARYFKLLSY